LLGHTYRCSCCLHSLDGGVTMRTGQIKRIGKRTYCIVCWTTHDVTLQSMDEDKIILVIPRTHMGGLRNGS
jgi:hypothetical protein